MKCVTSGSFPELRKNYPSFAKLGEVINRSRVTVHRKLSETGFTDLEKVLILKDLGIEDNEENRDFIFRR